MAPIGCAMIKTCLACVSEDCKYVILSTKPALCISEDYHFVDLFAKIIEAIKNCPEYSESTIVPATLHVPDESGYGTIEMIGIGIACAVAGVGLGLGLRSIYRYVAAKFGRFFRRAQAAQSQAITVVDDVPGIPNYHYNEFMDMSADNERPSSSCYPSAYEHDTMITTGSVPVLPVLQPVVINPLYRCHSSSSLSEVSLFSRKDKKQC